MTSVVLSETTGQLMTAIGRIQAKCPPIEKRSVGLAQGRPTRYADLDDVLAVVQPFLTKEKLVLVVVGAGRTSQRDVALCLRLTHTPTGEWIESTLEVPATSAQSTGSAITYARRYALVALLNLRITGEDDDGDAATGGTRVTYSDTRPATSGDPIRDEYSNTIHASIAEEFAEQIRAWGFGDELKAWGLTQGYDDWKVITPAQLAAGKAWFEGRRNSQMPPLHVGKVPPHLAARIPTTPAWTPGSAPAEPTPIPAPREDEPF